MAGTLQVAQLSAAARATRANSALLVVRLASPCLADRLHGGGCRPEPSKWALAGARHAKLLDHSTSCASVREKAAGAAVRPGLGAAARA
ncbi:unnamed protein product [Prorocentrum cordatum]|uniref:Uncharacterized protein n=1 Tax=Prorocentrum cordatum TaxID=2364126 RepID=A0ABN9SQN8_9DINO|nr:unnamed protein product [Polarella glacialis]